MSMSDRRALALPTAPRHHRGRLLLTRRMGRVAYHGLLIAICAVFVLPLLWMLSSSLKNDNEIFVFPPTCCPSTRYGRTTRLPCTTLTSACIRSIQSSSPPGRCAGLFSPAR